MAVFENLFAVTLNLREGRRDFFYFRMFNFFSASGLIVYIQGYMFN